jgi:hypothetical protein
MPMLESAAAAAAAAGPLVKPLFRFDNELVQQAVFSLSSLNDASLQGACTR